MARTIESPGLEINEIDLSLNATLPAGTNILVNGFADSGPTQELLNVTGINEYEQIYGKPTNAAERYAYHTMRSLLSTPAKVLFNRLPYGTDSGDGFNGDRYSILTYPIYSIIENASGVVVSGYNASVEYDATPADGESLTYAIGKPTQRIINQSEYYDIKAGNTTWATSSPAMTSSEPITLSTAGMVVINKLKTTVNQNFEGYYIGLSDNLKSSTTSASADYTFDSIESVYTSKNAVGGVTAPSAWASLDSTRLDFNLTGTISSPGSLSEAVEGIPTWDIGESSYKDSLIIGVYKLRRSAIGSNENTLTFIPYEGFAGSLGDDRVYTPSNSFQEATYNIQKIVDSDSIYLDVLVNPNISEGSWLADDGTPNKTVRVLSNQYIGSLSGITPSALNTQKLDALFTLGEYKEKTEINKEIGDVYNKLDTALRLAEDWERYPLDIILDGGLSTIHTAMSLSASATEYSDTAQIKGIFDNDENATAGLWDATSGASSLAATSWRSIFDLFNTFCKESRKDCMFIADCLRHQLVTGKNFKVLDNKTRNFSQHVYTPMKNLISLANSNYSAIYLQWCQVYDGNSGAFVWVPYSGFQGALMARLDSNKYPWYAPAGLEDGIISGVTDVAITTKQKQRDLLYRKNINAVAVFPNDGVVCWGQKTLQKKPSAFDRINVRRLFLTLEKSTRDIMKYFVFQPNTVFTRTRVVNVLSPIFEVAKNNEGVYDYLIVCDTRNNTEQVIDNNELRVSIYLKPVRSAEFILIDFYSTRTDQDFNELI